MHASPDTDLLSRTPGGTDDVRPEDLRVLALIAQGRTAREVAGVLATSANDVARSLRRLRQQWGTRNNIASACVAARRGLL